MKFCILVINSLILKKKKITTTWLQIFFYNFLLQLNVFKFYVEDNALNNAKEKILYNIFKNVSRNIITNKYQILRVDFHDNMRIIILSKKFFTGDFVQIFKFYNYSNFKRQIKAILFDKKYLILKYPQMIFIEPISISLSYNLKFESYCIVCSDR